MRRNRVLAASALLAILAGAVLGYGAWQLYPNGNPTPQTAYGGTFLSLCEGEKWFIDEVEEQLNHRQLSVYTLRSRNDLDRIIYFGKAGGGAEGKIPAAIGELRELKHLFLSDNNLSGDLPKQLFSLEKLESIDLTGNRYSGDIPAALASMPALRILLLGQNGYTGSLPESFFENQRLETLDVSGNRLSGPIPAELSRMTGLQYLALSDNDFAEGPVPDLQELQELKVLSAWNCGLSGPIPSSLWQLTGLQILDLRENRLELTPDSALSDMTALEYLSLGDNRLGGDLPVEIFSLPSLKILDLSDNFFRGTLPDRFDALPALESIHLENNRLTGHVPDSLKKAFDEGREVFLDDNYMTGDRLAQMTRNAGNFSDNAKTVQFSLTLPDYSRGRVGTPLNLCQKLSNTVMNGKKKSCLLLPAEEYECRILHDPEGKLTLSRDEDGIYVTAEEPVKKAEELRIEISIVNNTGSAFSRTETIFTTENPPSGGGGNAAGGPKQITQTALETVTHQAYMEGYPDGSFRPDADVTREQMAKILAVAAQQDLNRGAAAARQNRGAYSDVSARRWSAPFITSATALGLFEGYDDGTFRPAASISRAEFAAALVRLSGLPLPGNAGPEDPAFPDLGSAWYLPYLQAAAEQGWIEGYPDGTFRPANPVSRAEAVKMINLLLLRDPQQESAVSKLSNPYADVSNSHWAYLHILESGITHECPARQEERKGDRS